jgi:hypothetical protein
MIVHCQVGRTHMRLGSRHIRITIQTVALQHVMRQPACCIAPQASAARHAWQQAGSSAAAGGAAASTPGAIWAWLQQSTRGKTTMTNGGLKSYKPVTAGAAASDSIFGSLADCACRPAEVGQ